MASTLFTAFIIIGLTFLFIYFFSLLHKSGIRKKLAAQQSKFEQTVSTNHLTIAKKENFDKYTIAIDAEKGILVYFDFSNTEDRLMLIDLHRINKVKVDIEENSIYEDKKGKSVLIEKQLTKLQLELILIDNHQPKQLLPFYQLYRDGIHNFSIMKNRIEAWQNYINNYLTQTLNPI